MAEFGEMSRIFERVRKADPVSAAVLEAYYGEVGDKWAKESRYGRGFAIWPMTDAGRKLAEESAERSRKAHGFVLKPHDLLASEREAEARADVPNVRRRSLLSSADRQHRALLARAETVLAEVAAE